MILKTSPKFLHTTYIVCKCTGIHRLNPIQNLDSHHAFICFSFLYHIEHCLICFKATVSLQILLVSKQLILHAEGFQVHVQMSIYLVYLLDYMKINKIQFPFRI